MRLLFWRRPLTPSEYHRREAVKAVKGIRRFYHRNRPIGVNEVLNSYNEDGSGAHFF